MWSTSFLSLHGSFAIDKVTKSQKKAKQAQLLAHQCMSLNIIITSETESHNNSDKLRRV